MPKIPVYQQQVGKQRVQVRPADVTIQPTQAQFGGAESQTLQGIGKTISGIGQILQHKQNNDDKQDALDIATQFNLEQQDIVNGYTSRKLKAAKNSTIEWKKQTDKQMGNLVKNANPRVQQIARNLMNTTYASNRLKILGHETTQDKQSIDISLKTFKEISQNNIIEMPTSENFDVQLKEINGATIAMYTDADGRSQYSKEEMGLIIQQNNDETMDKTVTSLVNNGSYLKAGELLNEYKKILSPTSYDKLNDIVNKGKYIEVAKGISDSGLSYEDQLKEVDKIKDPMLLKNVRGEVNHRNNVKQSFQKAEYENYKEGVWEQVYNNPNFQIPTASLKSNDEQGMMSFQRQAAKQANGQGGNPDWSRYSKYKKMQPTELKKVSISEIVKINDKAMTKEIINRQIDAVGGKNQEEADRSRTILRQADDMVVGMDQFDKKSESGRILYNQYMEQFNKHLDMIPKKDQTEERVGQLINNLLAPVSGQYSRPSIFGVAGEVTRATFGRGQKQFRFETFYNADQGDKVFTKQLPANVPQGAKYDERSNRYYLVSEDIIKIYDPVTGLLLKQGRKNG